MRAMLLQILFSIRSERQLMEQTQYNMLFRCFAVSLVHRPGDGRCSVGALGVHEEPRALA